MLLWLQYVVMNKLLETPAEIMSMKLENAKLSSRIAILQDEMVCVLCVCVCICV